MEIEKSLVRERRREYRRIMQNDMEKNVEKNIDKENLDKENLKKLIDTASGRIPADLVIKNCKVVNVFSGKITEGDIAISNGMIAGIGEYEGAEVVDGKGRFAAPGFIDSHIHIEPGRRAVGQSSPGAALHSCR